MRSSEKRKVVELEFAWKEMLKKKKKKEGRDRKSNLLCLREMKIWSVHCENIFIFGKNHGFWD